MKSNPSLILSTLLLTAGPLAAQVSTERPGCQCGNVFVAEGPGQTALCITLEDGTLEARVACPPKESQQGDAFKLWLLKHLLNKEFTAADLKKPEYAEALRKGELQLPNKAVVRFKPITDKR